METSRSNTFKNERMTNDKQSLEAELRSLQATGLDEDFLSRLEAAAEGSLDQLTPGEIRFEEFLRTTSPAKLSPGFMASLEDLVKDVPFPMNEKIVLFPKGGSAPAKRSVYPRWSAAAAVALIGAATALLIPVGNGSRSGNLPVARNAVLAPVTTAANPANFVPASFNRGVSEVHDEGVVWKDNNQPHSVVRVVYKELVTLKDANGRTFQVEQPKVKYVLVPARAD